ncbi:MAG TPA: MFS transporter [Burkholderiales bacterium]|nr:MFS transporter [Burkholderiales bacterium]
MSGGARALAIVLFGTVVAPLDSAVNAAFPAITAAFSLEVAAIQWLVIAYMVTFSSLIIVSGRVADLFGHRRVFGWGLAVSALAFLGCGLAPGYGGLLAARVVQGVGVAFLLGAGPALALGAYPATERTRVLARYAAAFAIGLAAGPALGGLLVDAFGWRAVYLARVPIALGALLLLVYVPPTRIRPGRAFDSAGALLLAAWTGSLMLALTLRGAVGVGLGAAAAAAFALFVAREARAAEPTIRVALFRDAAFAVPNLASVAVHFAGFGIFLLGPYFFVRITGLSAQGAGLLLAVGPAAAALGSALAGRIAHAAGARHVALAGTLLNLAGVSITATWDAQTGVAAIAGTLALQGLGIGLFQVAYADTVIAALPAEDRGVAASLANLTRTFGVVSCAALMSALFAAGERAALGGGAPPVAAFADGFAFAFGVAATGLTALLALSFVKGRAWRDA